MERIAAIDVRTMYEKLGKPPEEWPPIPPLRGMSRSTGARVISALNGFCKSRTHQDEFVAKAEVEHEKAESSVTDEGRLSVVEGSPVEA
jgi:hypothetical protein